MWKPLPSQANRKQSMNYGCIVENEETNEVSTDTYLVHLAIHWCLNFKWLSKCDGVFGCCCFFRTGPALCWKAKHVCERYNQLWYIPVQPRDLPAHRCRLSEEPTGHVAVSWSTFSFIKVCVWDFMWIPSSHFFGSLHLFTVFLFFPSMPCFLFPYTIISYPYDG